MCKRYVVVLNVSYGRLRRGRASPVHRDGRRVQLAVHPQGHYLHLRGRRDPRARRTDPSLFFDVRGDEAHSTAHDDYLYFVNRVEKIVQTLGKRMLGWEDIEFIAFPRMADIAEISWSPAGGRSWQEVRPRLAAQRPRGDVMSVKLHTAPRRWRGCSRPVHLDAAPGCGDSQRAPQRSPGASAAKSHAPGSNLPTGRCSLRSAASCPGLTGRASSSSPRPAALASAVGRRRVDLSTPDGPDHHWIRRCSS
jgi:hypothetical protein